MLYYDLAKYNMSKYIISDEKKSAHAMNIPIT
jgi:hypothetical protein